MILALLLVCAAGIAQESHFQNVVTSADSQFTVDLSPLTSAAGAAIAITNNTGYSVSMPWISDAGSMPPLSKQSVANFLKQSASTDEAFAISAWQYVLDHTNGHCSAGSNYDPGGTTADPIHILYGYGLGCCDQQASLLAWFWAAAGYQTHVAVMPFHTIPEIYYSGGWHMLDPNHRVFYRNPDGSIASVAQILADTSIVANTPDGIGWSSSTMAQLYASNATSLQYVGPPWPEPQASELTLLPLETLEMHADNPWPDRIYQPVDSSETPLGPSAFATAVLRRWLPYNDPGWLSRAQAIQGVGLASAADGRPVLTSSSANTGFVVYRDSTPFPILSLQLSGEFFNNDLTATAVVYFSTDGVSWSSGVPLPLAGTTPSTLSSVDLTQFARGAYSYFIKVQFTGSSPGVIGAYELNIRSEAQMATQMFPQLVAGQVNTLEYRDLSPVSQPRQLTVEVSVPAGRPKLQGLTAQSQLPESPTYSIARNYQARRLVDGVDRSLAYPGSTQMDYVIHLGGQYQLSQVSLLWGAFGSNPLYVNGWKLYGRSSSSQAWQLLTSGGFPNCSLCDIPVNTTASDLRLTATGNNWIGAYEMTVYGDQIVPPIVDATRTITSNVPQDPYYSLTLGYGAASLIDGNLATLAYPAAYNLDYDVGLGGNAHVNNVAIRWGVFGTNSAYVNNWTLYGLTSSGSWTSLATGGFPAADTTVLPLDSYTTDLRLVASSPLNWIGAYEVTIADTKVLQPAVTFSNVPDGGWGYPASDLTDGNEQSLAYPGTPYVDYEVDFGSNTYLEFANIVWGYFGTSPIYVDEWVLYGQADGDFNWLPIARGGAPNAVSTLAPIHRTFRRLRISATSLEQNWIGIYELEPWAAPLATLPAQ